ncbi:adenosine deaminase [Cohnella xylanilytica]|uniref:adenosine deaminase n=1 Tax=Cohnella xylanilytica TaxID=557555 RepID=A0A841TYH9_9BACL|nr:adenosine deaminase [Cohnella xylanilytica]MBB6692619.1 adenosine deaminase [Cohnella xylanilytica]GIO11916.1 adenosine deaminase [Cohnella xylanilytica]
MDAIKLLPKVDLHLHLDGCVKPETILEWAAAEGVALPAADKAGLLPYMQADEGCASLIEYLGKFAFVLPFLQTEEALERCAYEVVEQAAEDRCIYVEVRFAPLLHAERGLSAGAAIDAVIRGLRAGEAKFGVKARVIAICMRHHSVERNLEVVRAAAERLGRGLAAVDLAGDEANHPPGKFREVFALARELGIPFTIHAGEAGGAANVEEAIVGLGAARIGHGVRARENPRVLELVRERGIPLELCPTSNIQTKAVSGWDDYPIRDYFDRGIRVTIHTDNPTVSGTSMTRECRALAERFGFTIPELARLMENAVEASFLGEDEKNELMTIFRQKYAELDGLPA